MSTQTVQQTVCDWRARVTSTAGMEAGTVAVHAASTLVLLVLSIVAAVVTAYIPCVSVGESAFFSGGRMCPGKLVFLETLVAGGYIVVAIGVFNKRAVPWKSRDGRWHELPKTLFGAFLLFWIAPIRTIASPGDDNGGSPLLTPEWPVSVFDSVVYNVLCYALPFMLLGLNFTYLDTIPILNRMFYKITWPPYVEQYGKAEIAVLLVIALVSLGLTAFQMYALYVEGLLVGVAIALVVFLVALPLVVVAVRRSHYFHFHHYMIFWLLAALTPSFNIITAIMQGALVGVYVEGGSTWGIAAWFYRHERPQELEAGQASPASEPLLE